MEKWIPIIVAALGSAGLFGFIQYLITRRDKKKDDIAGLKGQVKELQLGVMRTQLLLLIADYPEDKSEILRLAEIYFKKLNGNFYLSSIFTTWLRQYNVDVPQWFKD
jgi:hypothetical protein